MHSETTIQYVMGSVGWNEPINMPGIGAISDLNKASSTGRLFNGFHALVTSEDVYKTVGDDPLNNDQLNAVLLGFKKQGALEALTLIFNNSPQYNPLEDYAGTVVKYIGVIHRVYGYVVAAMAMQSMLTSKRINDVERKTRYGLLKTELEGVKNEKGVTVSRGLISRQAYAVSEAQKIIFPNDVLIIGENVW